MQMTIDEYARRYKMSKEMIRAKIRAGRLRYNTVDGMTYIIVETPQQAAEQRMPGGALLAFYQKENLQLKRKIADLEAKIDRLISDKEQMLRDERDRIETLYASRDEQLKSFLELVNAKLIQEGFRLGNAHASVHTADIVENAHEEQAAAPAADNAQVELFAYLDAKLFGDAEKKRVKKRFAKAYGNDIRVIQQNGEFILDFSKYDYSDLLRR